MMMANKLHKKQTLINWTKKDLINHIMALEHNNAAQAESFEIQYANCMKMIEDMNLLNKGLEAARKLNVLQGEGRNMTIKTAIETIEELYTFSTNGIMDIRESESYDALSLALDALRKQLWISVKDRMPGYDVPVLITYIGYSDGKLYSDGIAKWDIAENGYNGGWLWTVDSSEVTVEVTHWMPLPEPPEV